MWQCQLRFCMMTSVEIHLMLTDITGIIKQFISFKIYCICSICSYFFLGFLSDKIIFIHAPHMWTCQWSKWKLWAAVESSEKSKYLVKIAFTKSGLRSMYCWLKAVRNGLAGQCINAGMWKRKSSPLCFNTDLRLIVKPQIILTQAFVCVLFE